MNKLKTQSEKRKVKAQSLKLLVLSFTFTLCALSFTLTFAQQVPDLPSDVYVDSSTNTLMVKKPNDLRQPFVVKGTTWSPATRAPAYGVNPLNPAESVQYGFFFDWPGRNPPGNEVLIYWLKQEVLSRYATDIPLMKQMNVNTVRIYQNLGNDAAAYKPMLDEFYRNGIMVIMTVAVSRKDLDTGAYAGVVQACKNHPAILMWAIGNEWNLNKLYGYGDLDLAAAANNVNLAAQVIKGLDPHHPVSSVLGDKFDNSVDFGCASVWTVKDVVQRCPNVDLWGLNIYRGDSFGNLFGDWQSVWQSINQPSKPFYVSEFGIDSFTSINYIFDGVCLVRAKNVTGYADRVLQANVDVKLWNEIKNNLSLNNPANLCLGGLVHEFNDELWKAGSYHVGLGGVVNYNGPDNIPGTADDDHSYDSYNNEGFILPGRAVDNVFNEEHFGLVDADRVPKPAYNALKEAFKPPLADLVVSDIKFYQPGTGIEIIPQAGQSVTCKATLKNDGGAASGIFYVKWFLDGNQVLYTNHDSLMPGQISSGNVRFDWTPTIGTHTLRFVADSDNQVSELDENNNSFSVTKTITAFNAAPKAKIFVWPSWGMAPLFVRFSGIASSDPDGRIVSYLWDFGDGTTSIEVAPVHTFGFESYTTNAQTFYYWPWIYRYYFVSLTVTDDRGASATAWRTIIAYWR